ncbi:hypothetical protein [Streptomyces sp. NPDC053560]|uniref:lipase family protein n=1 Tax=Streptomyces sp. NPDC053560 TaxID=3365711 RepID=UPI0037CDC612
MPAGCRPHFEEPHLTTDGIHTFGQPRTCDRVLARAHDKAFTKRMFRFVNHNDVVPRMPPEPAYHRVQAVRYIDADGRVRDAVPTLGRLADRLKDFTEDFWELRASVDLPP